MENNSRRRAAGRPSSNDTYDSLWNERQNGGASDQAVLEDAYRCMDFLSQRIKSTESRMRERDTLLAAKDEEIARFKEWDRVRAENERLSRLNAAREEELNELYAMLERLEEAYKKNTLQLQHVTGYLRKLEQELRRVNRAVGKGGLDAEPKRLEVENRGMTIEEYLHSASGMRREEGGESKRPAEDVTSIEVEEENE